MRAFVLSTGRCGSTTFAKACRHLTNYTAGHETRVGLLGANRLAYPDQHIEVDNRLSWHLGHLQDSYGDDALYVHLTRDPDAVARSYLKRWSYAWRGGIIEAFAHGVLMHAEDWDHGDRMDVCRYYVDTVNANIRGFLRDKSHVLDVRLETATTDFDRFWEMCSGEGDRAAALDEWDVRHNASTD